MKNYTIQKEKLNQASTYLAEEDIDLWLIPTREGSDPGLDLLTKIKTVGLGAFLITAKGKYLAICSRIDAQDIEECGLFSSVITYSDSFDNTLKELIGDLKPRKIALNYSIDDHLCDGIGTGLYRRIVKALTDTFSGEYCSSQDVLTRIRSVKSPEELKNLKIAINITTEIYDLVFKEIRSGMSEIEIGELFVKEMRKRDVINGTYGELAPPMVLKERLAHRQPGEARLVPGDFLIIDFSVAWKGYCSDIARTAYVLKKGETEAPTEMQETFTNARDAISAAFDVIKPGKKGWEIDDTARKFLIAHKMPDITHATGHQIGLAVHDGGTLLGPPWSRYGKAPFGVIEEGMIFTLEPTILREKGYSALVEENILITEKAAEYLSQRQMELYLIPYSDN
jgi:Xaa-Pro aminopeptidase